MPFIPALRTTHSVISSSFSSTDDIHGGSSKEIIVVQVQFSKSSPRTIPRHSFLIRVIVFILLELSFIALVFAALWKPIILHLSFTNTEVKGAVTAIAILWHTLAVYVVKDILLNIFSAEWIEQYDGSQSLSLQELDSVSRLTTGFIDQVKHCISKRATHSFRLALLSSILLILLNGLGPSTIGVSPVRYDYPGTMQVANLTMMFPGISVSALQRSTTVIQLEVIQNSTTVGFSAGPSNILIPWPSSGSMSENMTMRYQSDVIRYNFSCSWEIPSTTPLNNWRVTDNEWEIYFTTSAMLQDPFIYPLTRSVAGSIPATTSLASFLFVGRNATPPSYLNLEDIPSLLLPCNTTINPTYFEGSFQYCYPRLVSVLVCDPQLEILPATINATMSSLEATILPGAPTVMNIPSEAANNLFSTSLLDATSSDAYTDDMAGLSAVSHQLFLPKSLFDLGGNNPLKPFSLDEINQNMNNVLASSAKPYLSGNQPDADNPMLSSFVATNTSAEMEVQTMALVGSKPFLVASSVTLGLLVAILGTLVVIIRPDRLGSFDLQNIMNRLLINTQLDSSSDP